MYPKLLHIYGPFEINSYGLAIAIGLGVFMHFTLKHPLRALLISKEDFINIVVESAIMGIIAGRVLHVISEPHLYKNMIDIISIWNGGLSVLGATFGVIGYAGWFLKKKNIDILLALDIAALYIPLLHCIARIGCFLAGCCYGCPTQLPWAITYTNPEIAAPLYIKLHPTQLYSSAIFLCIFLFIQFIAKKQYAKRGQITMIYLMLLGFERFFVDFFRGDRIVSGYNYWLSFHQWIAMILFFSALSGFIIIYARKKLPKSHHIL